MDDLGGPTRAGATLRRLVLPGVLTVTVVAGGVVGGVAWHQARVVERHLAAAAQATDALRGHVGEAAWTRARSDLQRAQSEARAGRGAAHGPLLTAARAVPWLGRTPTAVQGLADVADELASRALPTLLTTLTSTVEHGRSADAGVDVTRVATQRTTLDAARRVVLVAQVRLAGLPTSGVPERVRTAERRVSSRLRGLDELLQTVSRICQVLPDMLGAHGTRRYLVALQTNAEARGTGGLVGAYALLEATHGRLRLSRVGTDDELRPAPTLPVELGPDFRALYGEDPRAWASSNLSPHFPYAARIWLALWQRQFGVRLDGALALDPTALGYLLQATGPVPLGDGTTLRGRDVVRRLEQQAYVDYAGNNRARKAFLVRVARSTAGSLVRVRLDGPLLHALIRSVTERRLTVFSDHPREQELLAATPVAATTSPAPGPYAQLVVDNAGGNKLDYYLDRQLTYRLGPCRAGRRTSTISVTLTNRAPATPLPAYVTARLDSAPRPAPHANRLLVYVHAARGAGLLGATLDGRQVAVVVGSEQQHPVFVLDLELPAGAPRTLALRLVEPASVAAPVVPVQPLVRAQHTVVTTAGCAGYHDAG